MTDEELYQIFAKSKEPPRRGNRITMYNLLAIIALVPAFAPELLYEALEYVKPYNAVRAYLSALVKDNLIKKYDLKLKDSKIRVLYYITANGYKKATEKFPLFPFPEYTSKKGRKFSKLGMHDLGIGMSVLVSLAELRSFKNIQYEKLTPFVLHKHSTSYKELNVDVCSDAKLETIRNENHYDVYYEFDTGNEPSYDLILKIAKYYSHGLIEMCNYHRACLIITFRRESVSLPYCFRYAYVNKLIKFMDDGERIQDYYNKSIRETQEIVDDFMRYTPAFVENWDREKMKTHIAQLKGEQCKEAHDYLRQAQDEFARRRRNTLLNHLDIKYKNRLHGIEAEIFSAAMVGGDIWTQSVMTMNNSMAYLFLETSEKAQHWIESSLKKYFESIHYCMEGWTEPGKNNRQVVLKNIFKDKYNHLFSVEYLSGNITAYYRFLEISDVYVLKQREWYLVGIVDNKKELQFWGERFWRDECNFSIIFMVIGDDKAYVMDNKKQIQEL